MFAGRKIHCIVSVKHLINFESKHQYYHAACCYGKSENFCCKHHVFTVDRWQIRKLILQKCTCTIATGKGRSYEYFQHKNLSYKTL